MDLFSRLFTDAAWDLLGFAGSRDKPLCSYDSRKKNAHACQRPWSDVTVDEMKAFVGMLMLMGIYRLPQLELYGSTKHPLINSGLADVFPLVRFQQIFRFIHLNDSDQQVGVD